MYAAVGLKVIDIAVFVDVVVVARLSMRLRQTQLATAGWQAELSASQGPWALLTIRPLQDVA